MTASRCVGSRPWRSASTAARYRPGTTVTGSCRGVRDSRRPRVVSAASQLGSPRGRSRRPHPTPRLRVAPAARRRSSSSGSLASRGWSRSARSPHRILPVRCPDAAPPPPGSPPRFELSAPGTRLVFTGLRIVKTGAPRNQGESCGFRRRVRTARCRCARRDPAELGREMDNVAVVVEEWPTPRQPRASARARRCSGCTRASRSRSTGR